MSKKPFRNIAPSTIEATDAAITALEAFLARYIAALCRGADIIITPLETLDDQIARLMQTRGRNFRRKRARFLVNQNGQCSCCAKTIVDESGQPNTALIDYFILPNWGGPRHELNMTLVCVECGMAGSIRESMDVAAVVERAKAGRIPYLEEQSRLNDPH